MHRCTCACAPPCDAGPRVAFALVHAHTSAAGISGAGTFACTHHRFELTGTCWARGAASERARRHPPRLAAAPQASVTCCLNAVPRHGPTRARGDAAAVRQVQCGPLCAVLPKRPCVSVPGSAYSFLQQPVSFSIRMKKLLLEQPSSFTETTRKPCRGARSVNATHRMVTARLQTLPRVRLWGRDRRHTGSATKAKLPPKRICPCAEAGSHRLHWLASPSYSQATESSDSVRPPSSAHGCLERVASQDAVSSCHPAAAAMNMHPVIPLTLRGGNWSTGTLSWLPIAGKTTAPGK